MHACLQRACLLLHLCPHPSVCWCAFVSVWVWGSDSSSPGNPSRLPEQPAPTSWCMRSRWSGVAATTAQPYLITNKRVVPSVRYQAFSAKQTVIPASQTLALLPPSLRGESNIEIQRSGCNPVHHLYIQLHTQTNTHTHTKKNTYAHPKQTPCWTGPIALVCERNVSACREELLFSLFSGEGNINVQGATFLQVKLKTAAIKCLSPLKQNFSGGPACSSPG